MQQAWDAGWAGELSFGGASQGTRRAQAREREHRLIGALVIGLHLLLASAVVRELGKRVAAAEDESPMQLVYVHPVLQAREMQRPVVEPAAEASPVRHVPAAHAVVAKTPAQASNAPGAPLNLSAAADDDWGSHDRQRQTLAAERSAAAFERHNPIQPGPSGRFRMHDRSPAARVRAIAAMFFWPGGYSDDVCDGMEEAIEAFSRQASKERDRKLLADAVLQKSRYCH